MENNLQIGVVLKKRENIYTPEKTIYGYFKEEEKKFVDEDNTQYDIISSKKDNAVAFVFDVEVLLKLYNTDKENLPIIFFKDISNYLIVENEDDIKYIFKGEAPEILEPNEFANHFVSLVNGKNAEYFNLDTSKELCMGLYNKVFMQPEAIKKLVVGISTHYLDTEGIKKSNIIIDGKKGSIQNDIVSVLKDTLPAKVYYEDLSNENFSFDALFMSLANTGSELNSTLILDNAESLLFNPNSYVSSSSENTLRDLMMGIDYKIITERGIINYPTKDMLIIIMGDFSRKPKCGYSSYFEGVPEKLSSLTNYNIKLRPMNRDMILLKLCHPENGLIPYYINFFAEHGISLEVSNSFIEEICKIALENEHINLDKLVSTVFEEAIFEILTSDEQFTNLSVNKRVLKNNRNYILR